MDSMTQDYWRDIFLGDISSIPSVVYLRRWAANYGDEIKRRCPDYVDEVRAAYLTRIKELSEGK